MKKKTNGYLSYLDQNGLDSWGQERTVPPSNIPVSRENNSYDVMDRSSEPGFLLPGDYLKRYRERLIAIKDPDERWKVILQHMKGKEFA